MKIVKIKGGLGNQLFQYAFGKSIAKHSSVDVVFDLSWFNKERSYDHDIFYLKYFNTDIKTAGKFDIYSTSPMSKVGKHVLGYLYYKNPSLLQKYFNLYRDIKPERTTKDTDFLWFTYTPKVYDVGRKAYFDGYWQAAQYVDDVSETLKKDLAIKEPPVGKDKKHLEDIKNSNSISVHFRQKSYPLSMDYYRKAINKIDSLVDNPHYYIFADDMSQVKRELFTNQNATYMEHNQAENAHGDLRLMSNCEHNIIANSTFSWWGAWLNRNKNKRVISPNIWWERKTDEIDILPASWETLPARET
jgi:hypothetical protein